MNFSYNFCKFLQLVLGCICIKYNAICFHKLNDTISSGLELIFHIIVILFVFTTMVVWTFSVVLEQQEKNKIQPFTTTANFMHFEWSYNLTASLCIIFASFCLLIAIDSDQGDDQLGIHKYFGEKNLIESTAQWFGRNMFSIGEITNKYKRADVYDDYKRAAIVGIVNGILYFFSVSKPMTNRVQIVIVNEFQV
ncbi:uncharacterized protein LOC116343352 [Contarinia nasturtii]|uniref:uncharacterized protein LOC116343352 n=1 Tax=Contarinia nasturtii TaxID=265458 RepID=UPI0012D477B5|nr:uncharacterized protein LOC116343352 [Contarinia nasturtii]